jgi:hypothetical protein
MFVLKMTCGSCPEQYDVYLEETKQLVGYLRLRHGWFRCDYVDETSQHMTIFSTNDVKGDGSFEDDEREGHLTEALKELKDTIEKPEESKPLYRIDNDYNPTET